MNDADDSWQILEGKVLRGVRPTHDNGPVPEVVLLFEDGTTFTARVLPGVYFEGCLINTLRKAQPITKVTVDTVEARTIVTLRCRTFPLIQLMAVNKELEVGVFPFRLDEKDSD